MQAIIMAGGLGTRLSELTRNEIPKPLINICGKPLLQWQIENLKENGFDNIIVIVGHLKEKITATIKGVDFFEEMEPLGTAGALPKIQNKLEDEFLLLYGDLFFNVDFHRMIEFHHQHKATQGTLFIHPNSHPYDSDLVVLNKYYYIKKIIPKKTIHNEWLHNYTNAGIYFFNKSILNVFPTQSKINLEKDVLPHLTLCGYLSPEYVKDIGTTERYYQVQADINNHIPEYRSLKRKQKAIFLDRDGTINYSNGLIYRPTQFELFPYAADAIKLINQSEYLAIIITNQPVIARGLCTFEELDKIHAKMEEELGAQGAYINDIFFCPHHPDKGYPEEIPEYKIDCECRKPKPGLIYRAAARYNIDLSQSWMIGDTQIDYQTAINAGVKPIVTDNLFLAVQKILGDKYDYTF